MALKLRLTKERIKIDYRENNEDDKSPILATFYVEPLTSTELNDLFTKYQKTEWLAPNKKTKKELHGEIRLCVFVVVFMNGYRRKHVEL